MKPLHSYTFPFSGNSLGRAFWDFPAQEPSLPVGKFPILPIPD